MMFFDRIFKKSSEECTYLQKDITINRNINTIVYNGLDSACLIDVPKSNVIIQYKMNDDGTADCTITIKLHKSSFFNGSRSTVYENVIVASIDKFDYIGIYDAKLFKRIGPEKASQICTILKTKTTQCLYINNIDDFLK